MWLMLQQERPDDYVIATGAMHSVKEFLTAAFAAVGLDWQQYVVIDQQYFRPAEVNQLRGDASKAQRQLGWKPKVTFHDLVKIMLIADLKREGLNPETFGLYRDQLASLPTYLTAATP